jgi:hypothetical protein
MKITSVGSSWSFLLKQIEFLDFQIAHRIAPRPTTTDFLYPLSKFLSHICRSCRQIKCNPNQSPNESSYWAFKKQMLSRFKQPTKDPIRDPRPVSFNQKTQSHTCECKRCLLSLVFEKGKLKGRWTTRLQASRLDLDMAFTDIAFRDWVRVKLLPWEEGILHVALHVPPKKAGASSVMQNEDQQRGFLAAGREAWWGKGADRGNELRWKGVAVFFTWEQYWVASFWLSNLLLKRLSPQLFRWILLKYSPCWSTFFLLES